MSKKSKRDKRVVSARGRVEKHTGGFDSGSLVLPDGVGLYTAKAGTNRIDIIPYVVGKGNPMADEGDLYFERTYWTHRGIGPNNKTVVCLAKTFDKKCPICEERARMAMDDDVDSKATDALKPKERQLFAVIDINDRKKGVQVWDISHYLFGKALDAKVRNGDDGEYDLFADLEQGLTVKIGATEEKGGGYTFIDCSDIEFKPRKQGYEESLLEQVPCLDDLIKEESYKKLKEMFLQVSKDDDEEDEDEDEKPKKKGKKPADDDDDDDEDDEEDEKPAKGKGKKKPADEDEDDDEDEDEDEDEEDEEDEEDKPAKKSKVPAKGKGPAHKMGLKEGMKVEHEDLGECVIKHISGDGTSLRLEDEDGELHRSVDPEECEIIEEEEEKPKKGASKKEKAKPAKGKKSKDEDDEDDEEDEDDDDDDD